MTRRIMKIKKTVENIDRKLDTFEREKKIIKRDIKEGLNALITLALPEGTKAIDMSEQTIKTAKIEDRKKIMIKQYFSSKTAPDYSFLGRFGVSCAMIFIFLFVIISSLNVNIDSEIRHQNILSKFEEINNNPEVVIAKHDGIFSNNFYEKETINIGVLSANEADANFTIICRTDEYTASTEETTVENVPIEDNKAAAVETPVEAEPVKSDVTVMTEEDKKEDVLADNSVVQNYTYTKEANNSKWLLSASQNTYNINGYFNNNGFKYYNIDGKVSSFVGIDVSVYQKDINWSKVKASGVDFAMIRVGFRGYGSGKLIIDSKFYKNIEGAIAAGVNVGVYFFSQAINTDEAREEANLTLNCISKYKITYPVAIDTEFIPDETARTNKCNMTNSLRTDICITFCETVKSAGYTPMVYACKDWLVNALQISRLNSYDIWYARYAAKPDYQYSYTIWQYSDAGSIAGISGSVDMNVCLKDYVGIKQSEAEAREAALKAEADAREQELLRQEEENKKNAEEQKRLEEELKDNNTDETEKKDNTSLDETDLPNKTTTPQETQSPVSETVLPSETISPLETIMPNEEVTKTQIPENQATIENQ